MTNRKRGIAALLVFTTVTALVLVFAQSQGGGSPAPLLQSANKKLVIARLASGSGAIVLPSRLPGGAVSDSYSLADSSKAAEAASKALAVFYRTGNSRYLALAKTLLQPWWLAAEPAPEIHLLRGRIKQTEHQFEAAAKDLAAFNNRHPQRVEARLLEADSWRRAGKLARARKACLDVALQGAATLAVFCTAEIQLAAGRPAAALKLIDGQRSFVASLDSNSRAWALAISADVLAATGDDQRAAETWETIAREADMPLAYRLAYADLLLAMNQADRVLTLLDQPDSNAELLRVAAAMKQLGLPVFARHASNLKSRLDLLSGSAERHLHLRELALYSLWIEGDARRALVLAQQNWALQKGWEDTALLLQLARQLNDRKTLDRIEQWRDGQHQRSRA